MRSPIRKKTVALFAMTLIIHTVTLYAAMKNEELGIPSPRQPKVISPSASPTSALLSSLCFYVDFDRSYDAVFSRGRGKAVVIPGTYPPTRTTGNQGRFNESAKFIYHQQQPSIWVKDTLRYSAKQNFPYDSNHPFSGTIGMWIQVDIDSLTQRALIWSDPIHLVAQDLNISRNSGKLLIDIFTKGMPNSPVFRFGVSLPKNVRKTPKHNDEGHWIIVPQINFKATEWHHVIATWKNLNNTNASGEMALYLNGKRLGALHNFSHPLQWEIEDWEMRLGIGFKGKIDDFFVLDKYITDREVTLIAQADQSLGQLLGITKSAQKRAGLFTHSLKSWAEVAP